MALQNHREGGKRISDDYLSRTISSSTLEIVLDDRSLSDSGDEDSNDQPRYNIEFISKIFICIFVYFLIKDNQQQVLLNIQHVEEKNKYHYEFVIIKSKWNLF